MRNIEIAEALSECDWSGMPIGVKAIIKLAIDALAEKPDFEAGYEALIMCLEDCGDARQGLILALRDMGVDW